VQRIGALAPGVARPAQLDAADALERGTIRTVAVGEVLVQLGLSPVTAVLPGLVAALAVDAAAGAWMLTGYVLALAGTLLVCGRLGDLLGHRRIFGVGALVYAATSLASGFAPGFEALVAARVLAGVGAAMMSGNNLAILADAVPEERRGRAIALVATASAIAAVLGAGLGTIAVALDAWRLLFLAAVPLALWAALRARALPHRAAVGRTSVDWMGAALLVATSTLLALALGHPHTATTELVMPVFHLWLPAAAIVCAGAFVGVERRVLVPLLDWGQLRRRLFAASVGVNGVFHMTMMAGMFLGPLLVVRGLGLSAASGGALMVGVQSSVVATSFLGGWLYDRTRGVWIRPLGSLVVAVGLLGFGIAGWVGSYAGLFASGLFAGLGLGALLAVNNTVVMGSLPDDLRGVASGMLETTRQFGHALGVTIPTAIMALAASTAIAGDPEGIRTGFLWSCLAMAAVTLIGAALAAIGPRRAVA
jgi:MFS family permease